MMAHLSVYRGRGVLGALRWLLVACLLGWVLLATLFTNWRVRRQDFTYRDIPPEWPDAFAEENAGSARKEQTTSRNGKWKPIVTSKTRNFSSTSNKSSLSDINYTKLSENARVLSSNEEIEIHPGFESLNLRDVQDIDKNIAGTQSQHLGSNLSPFTALGKAISSIDISNLRVYIHPLPSKFNIDLARCAVETPRNAMCFDLSEDGYGRSVASTDHNVSFHNTHQFSLEVIFHYKLMNGPYVTLDPSEADIFYVPYYVAMRCFCEEGDGPQFNRQVWGYLMRHIKFGKPHVMALGKVEQEMSSKACPFLQSPNSHLLKYVVIEQAPLNRTRRYFGRLGREGELRVAPYPSYVHLDTPGANLGALHNTHKRSLLALLVASVKPEDVLRTTLAEQLDRSPRGRYYPIHKDFCWNDNNRTPQKILPYLRKSVFCLQPPGDTPTRKSFFDSLLLGCIPVIFHNDVVYPFQQYFNYKYLTVFVDEADILERGRNIIEILEELPQSQIRHIQKSIAQVARYFQYGSYRQGEDAVTLVLQSLVHEFHLEVTEKMQEIINTG